MQAADTDCNAGDENGERVDAAQDAVADAPAASTGGVPGSASVGTKGVPATEEKNLALTVVREGEQFLVEDMLFFYISPEKIRTVSSDDE